MTIDVSGEDSDFSQPSKKSRSAARQKISAMVVLFAVVVTAAIVLIFFTKQEQTQQSTVTLTTANILFKDLAAIPSAEADWIFQSLPDNWSKSRPLQGGFAWYRLSFAVKPDQLRTSAIFIPRLSMNGLVYVNGLHVGGNGDFTEPLSRQWYRPQLFTVPASLLSVGENTIHIRLKAYVNNKGGLSEVSVGPKDAITAQWRKREFLQIDSLKITSTITLGLSLMALMAWSLQGWPSAYGYFGAAGLLWVTHNTHYLAVDIPVAARYWELFAVTSLIWTLILIFLFVLRFANQKLRVVERVVWLFALTAPLCLLAASSPTFKPAVGIVYGALLLMGGYILKVLLSVALNARSFSTYLLFFASLVVYGLGAMDWFAQRDVLQYSTYGHLHYGGPILFSAVALNLFTRFGEAQKRANDLALSLEARVKQKTQELEISHSKLLSIEASQAQSAERARIMQDMHDGLGSQLVSSLALAQGGNLTPAQTFELIRGCIDDLRLAIDTSTDSRDSLPLALGNLRFRMEPRLKCAGITLKWDTTKMGESLHLSVEQQLPLLRIIQETITNTLKHASAQTLRVRVSNTPQYLLIDIADDGCGFDLDAAVLNSRGKGLNSLHKRARVLGAKLDINSWPQGTRTQLTLPLLPNRI